jgi:lysophospholipase L1-like esterase
MVHVGTNDIGRCKRSVLINNFRDLGSKLKARTSKVVFSEILPVPRATPERQREIRELNKWLRSWCRKEGFGCMENWADFAVGYRLYARDGLHLNGEGAAVLGEKMARRVEECLN